MRSRRLVAALTAVLLTAALVPVLMGCAPWAVDRERLRSSDAPSVSFADGPQMPAATSVGFHLELGENWAPTAGDPLLGYAVWEHDTTGCVLMVTVAGPTADLSHNLPDREGSELLLKTYGFPGGTDGLYQYPIESGGFIEMAVRRAEDETGTRITLAREFSRQRSALMIDLGCSAPTDSDAILRGLGVTATVATHEVAE